MSFAAGRKCFRKQGRIFACRAAIHVLRCPGLNKAWFTVQRFSGPPATLCAAPATL